MERARQIEIPINLFRPANIGIEDGCSDEQEQQIADFLSASPEIMTFLRANNIRRGDIVHLEVNGDYRNDGKYMFDGERVIALDSSLDEYGSVPSQFKAIDVFPLRHWVGVIEHNGIVHFDASPYVDEIMRNLEETQVDETGEFYKSSFTHANGETYTIYWTYQDNLPISKEKVKSDLLGGVFSVFDEVGFDAEIGNYDEERTLFVSIFSQFGVNHA